MNYQHEVLQIIPQFKEEVKQCFFLNNSDVFVSSSKFGRTLKLRERVNKGQKYLQRRLRLISPRVVGDAGEVEMTTVDFHQDKEMLATGMPIGAVLIWHKNEEQQRFYAFRSPVSVLKWSPSGKQLACADGTGKLIIRDLESKKVVRLQTMSAQITHMVWIDELALAVASNDGNIGIHKVGPEQICRVFKAHEMRITDLVHDYKTEFIISTSEDKTTKVWNLEKAKPVSVVPETSKVTKLAMWPWGHIFASSHDDAVLYLRDIRSPHQKKWKLEGITEPVKAFGFSPGGETIIGGFENGEIKGWDTKTGKLISWFSGKHGAVNEISWNKRWDKIVAGTSKGKVLYLNGGFPRSHYV